MNDATTPQKDFILSLMGQREVAPELRDGITAEWDSLTKGRAGELIDALKSLPYAPNGGKSASPAYQALCDLPKTKFAIPAGLIASAVSESVDDLMFVEVKEYKGTTYLRRLYGSWGDFRRERLSRDDEKAVVGILGSDPLRFVKEFGQHHARCANCNAELTDEKSRQYFLGPDCRKKLGIS